MASQSRALIDRPIWGLAYAWSGIAIMWAFWICFFIFLSSPRRLRDGWPLPTVDQGGFVGPPVLAALIDVALIALFGLQHSLMARPWFKKRVMHRLPPAFERCTYVHMANLSLFALVIFWQPITAEIWNLSRGPWRDAVWAVFVVGWVILFLGARSFGIFQLLGLKQMRAWADGERPQGIPLKTGLLYRWMRHPMYVGVLTAVWATPRMTAGHLLIAIGFTLYVLIALRYEERDLRAQFGATYQCWRMSHGEDPRTLKDTQRGR
jgi:methanethiol S-methyltransferase